MVDAFISSKNIAEAAKRLTAIELNKKKITINLGYHIN